MYSISAYEVDPCVLYFILAWFILKDILIFYSIILFEKNKILKHTCMPLHEITTNRWGIDGGNEEEWTSKLIEHSLKWKV